MSWLNLKSFSYVKARHRAVATFAPELNPVAGHLLCTESEFLRGVADAVRRSQYSAINVTAPPVVARDDGCHYMQTRRTFARRIVGDDEVASTAVAMAMTSSTQVSWSRVERWEVMGINQREADRKYAARFLTSTINVKATQLTTDWNRVLNKKEKKRRRNAPTQADVLRAVVAIATKSGKDITLVRVATLSLELRDVVAGYLDPDTVSAAKEKRAEKRTRKHEQNN